MKWLLALVLVVSFVAVSAPQAEAQVPVYKLPAPDGHLYPVYTPPVYRFCQPIRNFGRAIAPRYQWVYVPAQPSNAPAQSSK